MISRKMNLAAILIVFILGILIGCGSDTPPAPLALFQPEIVNDADNFSFQATNTQNVTTTINYTWSNSGSRASIDHSSVLTSGSAVVMIYDSLDSLVYNSALLASANEPTITGQSGNWTITVTLTNCYGTLNFRAQTL